MDINHKYSVGLPIQQKPLFAYASSLTIALLMTAASVVGITSPSVIYPTDELLQTFMPNDVVNLVIGLPILLGSIYMTHRGKLLGLLFWPGALLYILYTYIGYVFGLPFNVVFLLYLVIVVLSAYTIIGLVASIDGKVVQQYLTGSVPEKAAGGILAGLGILMLLRALGVLVAAIVNQTSIATTELPALLADFFIAPAVIIGGVLLWRQEAFGYVSGLGLLFQSSMLFIALIFFLLLQPLLTTAPFNLTDVIVVFIMGLICFIPFALFVRGVMKHRGS